MGNAIWIFLGIAILQAIVGGVAKSAEKRKKAEAAQRMLEAGRSKDGGQRSGVAQSPPMDTRTKANASAQGRLEALRKRRLEVLRRRSGPDGGVTAEIDPNAGRIRSASPTPPPPVATSPATVSRQQSARNEPRSVRKAASTRNPTPSTSATRGSKSRPEVRQADSSRIPKQAGLAQARRSWTSGKGLGKGTGQGTAGGSTARRLRRTLRTPKGFREALLLGELLRPPVGLRPPGDEVG
ncbi:MAG: hypothetical protein GWP75_09460 [Planctomycetia bacterium]|nr:hypothetical protein [Planctomycetia bacterium]